MSRVAFVSVPVFVMNGISRHTFSPRRAWARRRLRVLDLLGTLASRSGRSRGFAVPRIVRVIGSAGTLSPLQGGATRGRRGALGTARAATFRSTGCCSVSRVLGTCRTAPLGNFQYTTRRRHGCEIIIGVPLRGTIGRDSLFRATPRRRHYPNRESFNSN